MGIGRCGAERFDVAKFVPGAGVRIGSNWGSSVICDDGATWGGGHASINDVATPEYRCGHGTHSWQRAIVAARINGV
jgi:hypothetical protein